VDRVRADRLLLERGLFASRAQAQAAIAAGLVTANGVVVTKPSERLPVEAELTAAPPHPWVSRGGLKLLPALDYFGFDPAGRICLDVGASTGGFTDVLLSRGAARVYAVDVGHSQLHARLRARQQVVCLEQTDIRALSPAALQSPPDLIVIDVSFISLQQVAPAALALAHPPAQLLALIKPQYEAGRRRLKGGIAREPAIHLRACSTIAACVTSLGWQVVDVIASSVPGGDGNREFFLGATRD